MRTHRGSASCDAIWASRRPRSGEGFCAALNGGFIDHLVRCSGRKVRGGERCGARRNVEADGAHALAETVARDVLMRESRQLGIDLDQRHSEALDAACYGQARGAYA